MTATATAAALNFANHTGYSDVNPWEIVRRISDKTIEIRAMDCERDESFKPEFVIGGFSAHCTNQREQKWHITSNAANPTRRIRLQKNGQWKDANGNKYYLHDKPVKFYDINF